MSSATGYFTDPVNSFIITLPHFVAMRTPLFPRKSNIHFMDYSSHRSLDQPAVSSDSVILLWLRSPLVVADCPGSNVP